MKKERPQIDLITIEWIDGFKEKYTLSDSELSLQLAQDRSYIYHVRVGKMKMNKAVKAALWYYDKSLKINENN